MLVVGVARADGDEVTPEQKERARMALEKYSAGQYAAAIVDWELLYREVGPARGWKLSFNIARAYDKYGDSTRAAEHFEAFIRAVDERRDTITPEIETLETEAKERLEHLAATKARIKVAAGEQPTAVRVDGGEPRLAGFTAYVAPGRHVLVFGGGQDAKRVEIEVGKGEIIEVAPPAPDQKLAAPPPPPGVIRGETHIDERPFASTWLWIAGGATALSTIVPIVMYANASSVKSDYDGLNDGNHRADAQSRAGDYDTARSNAYATIAIPAVLAAATIGLATWYFLGTKERRYPITF